MVLYEAWCALDGVEALSGPHGGPLRRTIKLILDPLVIRPVQNPSCAGPIVTAEGAAEVVTLVHAAAPVLRATAEWFTLLKQVRRRLRITDGNPQDLYFQRCFELATATGAPDRSRCGEIAEATLVELHGFVAGRTTRALREYLTEPQRARELTDLIRVAWLRRPLHDRAGRTAQLAALLDACAAARGRPLRGGGRPALGELLAEHAGTHSGIRLWFAETSPSAQYLGLTDYPEPAPPPLGSTASTATLARPFDRSIYERVFTVLQADLDRSDLPTVPELVEAEIARSCAPWALLDESLRLAAAAGAVLAVALRPLGEDPMTDTDTAVQRVINGRWRREAYVLQARRLAVETAEEVDGPLAAVAADLRTPWRPYLRRLWVRLHGRDVRELALADGAELWDVLDGVARSVMLDHRMRVKQALSASSADAASESAESRVS